MKSDKGDKIGVDTKDQKEDDLIEDKDNTRVDKGAVVVKEEASIGDKEATPVK